MFARFKTIGFAVLLLALICMPLQANAFGRPAISCPSRDFSRFMELFASDVAVQQAHTEIPLRMTAMVDADPEPRSETRWLEMSEIHFPLMPGLADRSRQHLLLRIGKSRPYLRNVQISGVDTGYLVQYQFKYRSNCWKLISVEDQSL